MIGFFIGMFLGTWFGIILACVLQIGRDDKWKKKKLKLIKITTIYGEEFIRKEIKRNKLGVFTDKGFVPFDDIQFIDIIGEVVDEWRKVKRNKR